LLVNNTAKLCVLAIVTVTVLNCVVAECSAENVTAGFELITLHTDLIATVESPAFNCR